MAHTRYVMLPSGLKYKVYEPPDKDRVRLIDNVLISRWEEYCNSNWISDNHAAIDAPEKKVKKFLDGCADFILYCNADGVESDYKKMKKGKVEIPMSACTSHLENLTFSMREKVDSGSEKIKFDQMLEQMSLMDEKKEPESARKKKVVSCYTKLQRLKKEIGPTKFFFCAVDTANRFMFEGILFHISEEVEEYLPKRTREGDLYDFDKIVVAISEDGSIRFYSPQWTEIDRTFISQVL